MTKQAPASKGIASSDPPKALPSERISTGIAGLDRVLGKDCRTGRCGIFVPSLVMVSGQAGVGMSTLMLQMATTIKAKRLLYITTDISTKSVRDHAERVGMTENQAKNMTVEFAQEKQEAIRFIQKHDPQIVVIDTVNDMSRVTKNDGDFQANMFRAVMAFKKEAENNHRTIFLIVRTPGKEYIAGIQRIQHIVSTVIQMQMDPNRGSTTRKIRCPDKNRFGDTREVARFSMTEKGLVPADDESDEHATAHSTATKDDRKHQVVIRIPSSLHEKLKRETESRQAANPGITITQSDVIRTILFDSLR